MNRLERRYRSVHNLIPSIEYLSDTRRHDFFIRLAVTAIDHTGETEAMSRVLAVARRDRHAAARLRAVVSAEQDALDTRAWRCRDSSDDDNYRRYFAMARSAGVLDGLLAPTHTREAIAEIVYEAIFAVGGCEPVVSCITDYAGDGELTTG